MKVLVTGHHGYLGSVTGPALVAAGHDVTGLDTLFYRGCDLGPVQDALPALELDVRDVTADDLRGFDAVVHLAALSNDPLGDLDPELTHEINFRATVDLARAAREAGVSRFVFASSCSMYGASEDERVTEDAPLKPITAYAESKVRSEEALAELADDDFSPVFMRNATVHGVSPRLRIDIVLNNLVGWAFTTGAVRILSDGTPWRPVIHVADVADATVALLEAPRETVHGQAFNVGADSRELPGARPGRARKGGRARAARSSTAARATPTRGRTAWTSGSSPGRCPSSGSAAPRARARRSSMTPTRRPG